MSDFLGSSCVVLTEEMSINVAQDHEVSICNFIGNYTGIRGPGNNLSRSLLVSFPDFPVRASANRDSIVCSSLS